MLSQLAPNSWLFAPGDDPQFALVYLRFCENVRPDIAIMKPFDSYIQAVDKVAADKDGMLTFEEFISNPAAERMAKEREARAKAGRERAERERAARDARSKAQRERGARARAEKPTRERKPCCPKADAAEKPAAKPPAKEEPRK